MTIHIMIEDGGCPTIHVGRPPPPGWLGSLTDDQRLEVFESMRKIGDLALVYSRRQAELAAPSGTIGVGCADFDEFLKAEGAQQFLVGLRLGDFPSSALEHARLWARIVIRGHNKKSRDVNWQRSEESVDGFLAGLVSMLPILSPLR